MRKTLRFVLPILVLALGVGAARALIMTRKPAEKREISAAIPLVETMRAKSISHQFVVESQGTVVPRTEIDLISEVTGKVIRVSPQLASGGMARKGEPLAVLESTDYRAAVAQAKAALAQATLRLAQEEAQAQVAREEWERLGEGEASDLTNRNLFVDEARASKQAAEANLAQAEKNLSRTSIRAPFDGRVRAKFVDVGQFVAAGTPVAKLFAIDFVEVRLPLPGDVIAFVDLPSGYEENPPQPEVKLFSDFGDESQVFTASVHRTEGEIDAQSRVLNVVARVEDPYRLKSEGPFLKVGQFVNAEIEGRRIDNVFVLPRSAIRGRDQVCIVDDEDRLRLRTVDVLRFEGDRAIVKSGLEDGDRVCVSPLETSVDGMKVRPTANGTPETEKELP